MDDTKQLCPKCKGYHSDEDECPESDDFPASLPVPCPPPSQQADVGGGTSSQSGSNSQETGTNQQSSTTHSTKNERYQSSPNDGPELVNLKNEISDFIKKYPQDERIIVAVFGIQDCGKSFLNKRLEKLRIGGGSGNEDGKEVPRSNRNQYSTREFKMRIDDKLQRNLLVVDVPGEQIVDVTHRGNDAMFDVVRSAMNLLVLYISADYFESVAEMVVAKNKYLANHPEAEPTDAVERVTKKIKQLDLSGRLTVMANGRTLELLPGEHFESVATLVAAENQKLADNPAAEPSDAVNIVSEELKRLKLVGWLEVKAQNRTLLLTKSEKAQSRAGTALPWNLEIVTGKGHERHSPATAYGKVLNLCAYDAEKMTNEKVSIPVLVCLSKADLLFEKGATDGDEALNSLSAAESSSMAREYVAKYASPLLKFLSNSFSSYSFGLVASHVGAAPQDADETYPSYGVGGLLEVLLEMHGAQRQKISEQPSLFWSYDHATMAKTYPQAFDDVGTRSTLILRSPDRLLSKIVRKTDVRFFRFLRFFSFGIVERKIFSVLLASMFFAIFGFIANHLAQEHVSENRLRINRQVQEVINEGNLPEQFRVMPQAAWKFTKLQIVDWIAEIKTGVPEKFGLERYPLIGPPDPRQLIGHKEDDEQRTIEAFNWIENSVGNGKQIDRFYAAYLHCEAQRPANMQKCLNDTLTLMEAPKHSNIDINNSRAYYYMEALYHYWRAVSGENRCNEVQNSLDQFEARMHKTFVDPRKNQVKDGYLPFTAKELIRAHTQFITAKEPAEVLERYGYDLETALRGGTFARTGFVHNKNSLAAIGVNQSRLAYHLFAAALTKGEGASKLFDDRLKTVGLTRETALKEMKSDASAGLYPELACVLESGVFTEAETTPAFMSCTKAYEDTSFSIPEQNGHANMFIERGALTETKNWRPPASNADGTPPKIRYWKYLDIIKAEAQERLKRSEAYSVKEKTALKQLNDLKIATYWTALTSVKPLFCLISGVVVALLTLWLTSRFLALNRVASLRTFNTWKDN